MLVLRGFAKKNPSISQSSNAQLMVCNAVGFDPIYQDFSKGRIAEFQTVQPKHCKDRAHLLRNRWSFSASWSLTSFGASWVQICFLHFSAHVCLCPSPIPQTPLASKKNKESITREFMTRTVHEFPQSYKSNKTCKINNKTQVRYTVVHIKLISTLTQQDHITTYLVSGWSNTDPCFGSIIWGFCFWHWPIFNKHAWNTRRQTANDLQDHVETSPKMHPQKRKNTTPTSIITYIQPPPPKKNTCHIPVLRVNDFQGK